MLAGTYSHMTQSIRTARLSSSGLGLYGPALFYCLLAGFITVSRMKTTIDLQLYGMDVFHLAIGFFILLAIINIAVAEYAVRTEYEIEDGGLIKTTALGETMIETDAIDAITLEQGWVDTRYGTGDLIVEGPDAMMELPAVKTPQEIKTTLEEMTDG